jgi:hypothetical protein
MQIHQLNVSHVERQDRLLLRLNTQTAEEFRFWLTRRMALRLMPALDQSLGRLESSEPRMMASDPASQQILTELKRDAFMQEADFKTPFTEEARTLPLGEEPMLVTDVQLQLQGNGLLISLQDKGRDAKAMPGQLCQLHLQASLVHGLVHLIRQVMEKAEWITAPERPGSANQAATPAMSGYRH